MNSSSPFTLFAEKTRPALREELVKVVQVASEYGCKNLEEMITYQMGWTGDDAGPKATGKQIRPLLVLLSTEAAGGKWQVAIPAAASVELIHNFSLIHDDIEDNSEMRRGRPTVWKLWGEAQAINTGDAMFALANLALVKLGRTLSPKLALEAEKRFHTTCLRLTQGQHLDIQFEEKEVVSEKEYWQMVSGKTAALLAFCVEVGALCANAPREIQKNYFEFGINLGKAFQVQDDILGIWGDQREIGKSTIGDLLERKKTLPVIYGLTQKKAFYQQWKDGPIDIEKASILRQILEEEGALTYAQSEAERLTDLALNALDKAQPQGDAGDALKELTTKLLSRRE